MSDEELIAQWDDYVESMSSVMGEVEYMAQQMRDRIEALVKERDAAYAYAKHLAEAIFANSQFDAPQWEPLEDTLGVLTQIDNMVAGIRARAERLEAALRAIQTYLQEPAPENKLNDLRNDLRWIGNRARAALKEDDHD